MSRNRRHLIPTPCTKKVHLWDFSILWLKTDEDEGVSSTSNWLTKESNLHFSLSIQFLFCFFVSCIMQTLSCLQYTTEERQWKGKRSSFFFHGKLARKLMIALLGKDLKIFFHICVKRQKLKNDSVTIKNWDFSKNRIIFFW